MMVFHSYVFFNNNCFGGQSPRKIFLFLSVYAFKGKFRLSFFNIARAIETRSWQDSQFQVILINFNSNRFITLLIPPSKLRQMVSILVTTLFFFHFNRKYRIQLGTRILSSFETRSSFISEIQLPTATGTLSLTRIFSHNSKVAIICDVLFLESL